MSLWLSRRPLSASKYSQLAGFVKLALAGRPASDPPRVAVASTRVKREEVRAMVGIVVMLIVVLLLAAVMKVVMYEIEGRPDLFPPA